MTLLYRVGDEIILHAPREVLKYARDAIADKVKLGLPMSAELNHHLTLFVNALRAEEQHEPIDPNEDLIS